jgi:hypothetical protein
MSNTSCCGCKFLYSEGEGYSNYTWMDTNVCCAKDNNPNLPATKGYDWNKEQDNWKCTNNSRCELFSAGPMIEMDVDGDDGPADFTDDEEAIVAVMLHSGRNRNGS